MQTRLWIPHVTVQMPLAGVTATVGFAAERIERRPELTLASIEDTRVLGLPFV